MEWLAVRTVAVSLCVVSALGLPDRAREAAAAEASDDVVALPTDRVRERQLAQVRKFLADGRWSDAASLCDEILAAPRDAFLRDRQTGSTRRSLKSEVSRLLREQPEAATQAYELLHAARAAATLAAAVAADDHAAILTVARRWFDTPAGRAAAILAATVALENEQPAIAAAWLERLAAGRGMEPWASLARQIQDAAGREADARRNGIPLPDGWRQHRGNTARNAIVPASRPLLVPRYRVPLVRHPAEARLLDRQRQVAAAQGIHLMPAGSPLAVDGLVLVQAAWGIVAIDFETGKRRWMRPAGAAGERGGADDPESLAETVFENATVAGLVVAAERVCVIESPAEPSIAETVGRDFGFAARPAGQAASGGNRLSAYDLAQEGRLAWRLPAAGASTWYLGPPLAVGHDLYVLAEEKGEIRLDVIDARGGTVNWSQPLAEVEANQAVTESGERRRRLAGLTPALDDGVLVCPLGVGTVVALDLATRTLLWAHQYRTRDPLETPGFALGPRRPRGAGNGSDGVAPTRPRDSCPVISAGRVLLAAYDADELICLDLREGTPVWPEPCGGGPQLAGVVENRVIVIGPQAVEAIDLNTSASLWRLPWRQAGGHPSGRGIVTPDRLLLPLDSAEVVEIRLADGTVSARCPARGGVVPGNLIAHRGEVLSRGIDTLDVFHQIEPLEERIQTAALAVPESTGGPPPTAAYWRGQLDLEAGRVGQGLALVQAATESGGVRLPPGTLADAVIYGMRRDFAAAAPVWRAALVAEPTRHGIRSERERAVLRCATDGFLSVGNFESAWETVAELLPATVAAGGGALVRDPSDQALDVREGRWLRGRIAELLRRGPAHLAAQIDALAAEMMAAEMIAAEPAAGVPRGGVPHAGNTDARGAPESPPLVRLGRLELIADMLGALPAAATARRTAIDLCDRLSSEQPDMADILAVRRDLQSAHVPGRSLRSAAPTASRIDTAAAWPLGRVAQRREDGERDALADVGGTHMIAVPVEADPDSAIRGITLAFDMHQRTLLVRDADGRRITEPLRVEQSARRVGVEGLPSIEAAALGRLLFVRFGGAVMAFDLLGRSSEQVWTHAGGRAARQEMPFVLGRGWGQRPIGAGCTPLGMRITEPDDGGRTGFIRAGRARPAGVLHAEPGTVTLLDPARGLVLWERRGLPAATELVGDDDVVCVVALDGRESPVLSMADGRLLHTCAVPPRRQRIGASGRRIVAVRFRDDAAPDDPLERNGPPQLELPRNGPGRMVAPLVDLELFDPFTREGQILGSVPGESRSVMTGDDRLVVLTPAGELIVFDLSTAREAFRTRLPEMPMAFRRLHVMDWDDRYLVIAGTEHPVDGGAGPAGALQVSPLQQLLVASEMSPPLTGAVWAVDRDSGSLLWPVPAMIDRHCLHTSQPSGLPVLLFCRLIHGPQDRDSSRLSLLCLDRRTGHAVLDENALPVQRHAVFGCEIEGDPAAHTVTVRELGSTGRRIVLDFTGRPLPPQPPFRAPRTAAGPTEDEFEWLFRKIPGRMRPPRDAAS